MRRARHPNNEATFKPVRHSTAPSIFIHFRGTATLGILVRNSHFEHVHSHILIRDEVYAEHRALDPDTLQLADPGADILRVLT